MTLGPQDSTVVDLTTDVHKFVQLNPTERVVFKHDNNVSKLEISNFSPTKNIVFKIRTTQPLCYVVKPNSGIIEASGKAVVDINYVPNDVSTRAKDRFLSEKVLIRVLKLLFRASKTSVIASSRCKSPTRT